ncbi:MAG: hypothetical protein IJW19_03040 [Clostridia bacterium]|nr:hypothetical protein [Clostridia bacterium]
MFSKLLKYDFKSLRRFGIPLVIIILSIAVVGMISGMIFGGSIYMDNMEMVTVMSIMLFMGIIFVLLLGSSIITIFVYIDFYKSLCTDQAYLTFTLPVKSTTLLNSKLLNAVIWSTISLVTTAAGICMTIFGLLFGLSEMKISLSDIQSIVKGIFSMFANVESIFTLFTVIAYMVNSLLLIFMVIFFASVITKNHKAIVAIALVLATNLVYSVIYSLVSSIISMIVVMSGVYSSILISCISIVLLLISGAVYYILTKYMMDKKLNLA